MPFSGYEDWDACVEAQLRRGHSQDSADRICGALKRDTEDKSHANFSEVEAVRTLIDDLFSNANDCHDPETGQFCADAASLGLTIGKPERVGPRLQARILSGYTPKGKRSVINTLWHWQGSTGVREQGPMHHYQEMLIDRRGNKSNANDCHDERGQFCSDGGSGAGPVGETASERLGREARESLAPRVKAKGKEARLRTGIGPKGSVYSAEKAGKEYGFAKKVSYYQAKSVDLPNEINTQMAELSDETGLVMERVYIFNRNSREGRGTLGYHQPMEDTIGVLNTCTAEWHATQGYNPEERVREYARMQESLKRYETSDPTSNLTRLYREEVETMGKTLDYQAYTHTGNGIRNPTVDHEFAHALVSRVIYSREMNTQPSASGEHVPKWQRVDPVRVQKLDNLGRACRMVCYDKKFSVYGSYGASMSHVKDQEAIAEIYSYWKANGRGSIPKPVEDGLIRLENFRPGPTEGRVLVR